MIATCAWCPECLAKNPDLHVGDICPTHNVEIREEKASAGFFCETYHHPELWDGWRGTNPPPKGTKRKPRPRKPRPKKSQR